MIRSTYDWLPDHHLGVAAALAHADDAMAQAADVLFDYQTQPGGIIGLRERPMGTYSQTIVTGMSPIPRKVPLLVADALVALRNALEHTLFAEIEYRDGVLDDNAARLVEMPAAKRYDDFQTWVTKRQKSGPESLRKGSDLLRRIDGLQPFHRTQDPQAHPLALLALHTNYSKHRAPAITAVRLAAMYREDQAPPPIRDLERRPEVPLQVGDVLAEMPMGTRVPVTLFPTIGINRPGTDRWPVLMNELDDLSTWVRFQAVPRLITGAEPLRPALPARYEIAIGHEDERSAISSGSAESAAQLHQQRLGAASARIDMVEMIGMMEDAPSAEQIADWLDSLTDQEVLARIAQIEVSHNRDLDIAWNNIAVLEGMCDEACRFAGLDEPVDDRP